MGLYKRGKVWWMSYTLEGKRVRRSLETEDKQLAKKIEAKGKTQLIEGKWFEKLPGGDKGFKEMMDKYEGEHVSQLRSVRQHKGFIKNLRSFFANIPILEITPSLISDFKMKRRGDGVGPASINRELSVLKKAFNKALKEWGWVKENPVAKIPMEKEPKGRVRYLRDGEFQSLYDACAEWLKPILLVARHTGMRKGNILSLKWDQVDLFRKEIILEHTKNGERLGIPLNETMMGLFKSLFRVRHANSPYVFCHRNGRRFVELKTSFREALKKAGIQDFRFHDLRHCFASSLVQNGVDLYQVQMLLGHKDSRMTQRYSHLAPENLRNAVLKLDRGEKERDSVTNRSQSVVEAVYKSR
jgi:integrase